MRITEPLLSACDPTSSPSQPETLSTESPVERLERLISEVKVAMYAPLTAADIEVHERMAKAEGWTPERRRKKLEGLQWSKARRIREQGS